MLFEFIFSPFKGTNLKYIFVLFIPKKYNFFSLLLISPISFDVFDFKIESFQIINEFKYLNNYIK